MEGRGGERERARERAGARGRARERAGARGRARERAGARGREREGKEGDREQGGRARHQTLIS